MRRAAVYRTRCPGRAPSRAEAGLPLPPDTTLPPTRCFYDRASPPESRRTARGKSVAHGRLGFLQHALKRLAKFVAIDRISQRKFDERFKVTRKIPDIV